MPAQPARLACVGAAVATCYSPTTVWVRHNSVDKRFYYRKPTHFDSVPKSVPCGKCINCRIRRARDWATRICLEAHLHPLGTSFMINPTYDPEHLPAGGTLVSDEVTRFIERLRYRTALPLRFVGCGEYGDKGQRPHYHVIVFGLTLDGVDGGLRHIGASKSNVPQFKHRLFTEVWGKGRVVASRFEPGAASYVAGYVVKKLGGQQEDEFLRRERIDPDTGVVSTYQVEPEYFRMSRRPGIGHGFFEKYPRSMFPSGFVLIGDRNDRRKVPIPAYFGKQLWKVDMDAHDDHYEAMEERALQRERDHPEEYTERRLQTFREIAEAREARTKRQ